MMLVRGLLRSAVLTWCCARLFFLEEGFLGADSRVQPLSYVCRCLGVQTMCLFAFRGMNWRGTLARLGHQLGVLITNGRTGNVP